MLWKLVHHLRHWTGTPVAARGELFTPTAHGTIRRQLHTVAPPDLRPALDQILVIFPLPTHPPPPPDDGANAEHDPEPIGRVVAAAAREVARWAHAQRYPQTALEYAQIAALAAPEDARLAYEVGRRAYLARQLARAETWLHHALHLARGRRQPRLSARVHLSLGIVAAARGDAESARHHLRRAERGAKRLHNKALTADVAAVLARHQVPPRPL